MSHQMDGKVNFKNQLTTEVQIFGSVDCVEEKSVKLTAIVDTGFSGGISASPNLIHDLGADWIRQELMTFANDKEELVDVFGGFVLWNDHPLPVALYAMGGEETNIGMDFLLGKEVSFQGWPGGSLVIRDGWDSMSDSIQQWLRNFYPHLAH